MPSVELPPLEQLTPLNSFFLVVSFILGAVVGSFCNVCASRWPAGESAVSPRSRCPKCMSGIAWYDNIPLISWLVLGARCRNCKTAISWQYPLVEALTGVLFLAVFWRFGFELATPVYMLLCAGLVIVTFQDLADWTIPDEITLPGILIGLLMSLVGMVYEDSGLRVTDPLNSLGGILLGGGIIYLLDRITVLVLKKPGMGFGDVKLLAMLGAFLGWAGALGTLILAAFAGSIAGIAMLLFLRMRGEEPDDAAPPPEHAHETEGKLEEAVEDEEDITLVGHYLPFGPYLALGGIIYLFFGPELVDLYLRLLTAPAIPAG